jgi:hypothetical protein
MKPVDALCLGATLLRDREAIDDPDPLDDQDAVLVLDVSDRLDLVALRIDLDLTRLQRAGERAGQSPTGRGDDIVERRRVGRILLRSNAVMLRDLRMDTEGHRLLLGRQMREPLRSAQPLDPHTRHVGDIGHRSERTPTTPAATAPALARGRTCLRRAVDATAGGNMLGVVGEKRVGEVEHPVDHRCRGSSRGRTTPAIRRAGAARERDAFASAWTQKLGELVASGEASEKPEAHPLARQGGR